MKITMYQDYPEDRWESMQVYTRNLIRGLRTVLEPSDSVSPFMTLLRLSAWFSKKRKLGRYVMRYAVNPIGCLFTQGDVNHITDQSNAHLLRVLNPDKTVITCHDLIVPMWEHIFTDEPDTFRARLRQAVKFWRIRSLTRARAIIAVSEFTKKELITRLGVSPERIIVIHEGVESLFRPQTIRETGRIRMAYNLPRRFLLHVGTNAGYKNMPYMLRCFAGIRKTNPDLHFVKIGGAFTAEDHNMIRGLGLNDRVRRIPGVPRADLPALYASSQALFHLSVVEGFGLTVLEAMATGTQVFVSDIPVMHEVTGDAGWYIPITDRDTAVREILRGLTNKTERSRRIEQGVAQAARFTWRRCAEQTAQAYRMVLSAS